MKKIITIVLDEESMNETVHFYDKYEQNKESSEKDYIFSLTGDTVYYFIDDDILNLLRAKKKITVELNLKII